MAEGQRVTLNHASGLYRKTIVKTVVLISVVIYFCKTTGNHKMSFASCRFIQSMRWMSPDILTTILRLVQPKQWKLDNG